MKVLTGTYSGNSAQRRIFLGVKPSVVIVCGDTAQFAAWHAPTMWCGRSAVFGASSSYNQGCTLTDDGFVLGFSNAWNNSGVTYHYVAIVETDEPAFSLTSYMGNATNPRTVRLPIARAIKAAIIKRDSGLPAVIATDVTTGVRLNSTAGGPWVNSLAPGEIRVTANNDVNELDGPGGLGEGIEVLAFHDHPTVATGTYLGDGTQNRLIAQAPFPVACAIVWTIEPVTTSARIKTATMAAGVTKPINAAALQANELTFNGGQLLTGTATALNLAGTNYGYLLLAADTANRRPKAERVSNLSGKRAVMLRSGYIDCGTNDGALLISGPMSVEWCGAIVPGIANTPKVPLIVRGAGPLGTAGAMSWGIEAMRSADGTAAWPGPQFNVIVGNRTDDAVDVRLMWRTGIIVPINRVFHVLATHAGNGEWSLYLDGKFVKQRSFDMTTLSLPNIQSTAGHRTVIGARGSAFVDPSRMLFRLARVYSVGLTADQAAARYANAMLGAAADVTSGLAEEWSADRAIGNSVRATVLTANTGSVTNGVVVTL